jgi:hypothetical protein
VDIGDLGGVADPDGQLHSECNENGCGITYFVPGADMHVELERDEAIIIPEAFDINCFDDSFCKEPTEYKMTGTVGQIASAINALGGGTNWDEGAKVEASGKKVPIPRKIRHLKKKPGLIEEGSVIINRTNMLDPKTYTFEGTAYEIASQINSLNGNGVELKGAEVDKFRKGGVLAIWKDRNKIRKALQTADIMESGHMMKSNHPINKLKSGGQLTDKEKDERYSKWKKLVNMSKSELQTFYNSKEGKEAGLSQSEANKQGISSGRQSARWIMKMKDTPKSEWTNEMWRWAGKQISFISRMTGNEGPLYDDQGNKTRKHTSLLIWGNNPKKKQGGNIDSDLPDENKGGDCYYVAGKAALNRARKMGDREFIGTPYVVHAQVIGQGAIEGLPYGHAWVEDDVFVYDFSNGRSIVMPKEVYYMFGKVTTEEPLYYKYTFEQAVRKMAITGHYGGWDLQTESGL